MWRAPNRPKAEITQNFNDGVVTIYEQKDEGRPGYQAQIALTKKIQLRFEEQKLGIQRFYSAAQNQQRIERVIRVPRTEKVNAQDVAKTHDGKQYRIELVQLVPEVFPPSVDLTLSRIEQIAEVAT